MVHPDVWPAYHHVSGSTELDVTKHWDVLGRLHGKQPKLPPFDLVLDLGANWGLVTEKLVMRRFAKDYIMIDAYDFREVHERRFLNPTWRREFLSESVASWPGALPVHHHFEFLNFALSDKAEGSVFICGWHPDDKKKTSWNSDKCTVKTATMDSIVPGRLSPKFAQIFANAQSAYVKLDVEGMEQLTLQGMTRLLSEKRDSDYLVNFMMLEYCTPCVAEVRKQHKMKSAYDLKTLAATLESLGFEAFLMGPRYIPLTHGSWDDDFVKFIHDEANWSCDGERYPMFKQLYPEVYKKGSCQMPQTFTGDVFAVRATYPKVADIKVALGSCAESHDFDAEDAQYEM
jgi:hypothetical protein